LKLFVFFDIHLIPYTLPAHLIQDESEVYVHQGSKAAVKGELRQSQWAASTAYKQKQKKKNKY